MLVECEFIPTGYLILLAIIMCEKPKLEYPKSKSKLFNGHCIDLLLEEGAILLTKKDEAREKEDNMVDHIIHTKQKLNEEIDAKKQKWIQIIPEEQYKGFVEHCNSSTFDWRLTTVQEFKSELKKWYPEASNWTSTQIYNLKLHMLHGMKQKTYIESLAERLTILPPTSRNMEKGQKTCPPISRDVKDGNYPNYCQSSSYELIKSKWGSPLCNYCGLPSHRRQNCIIKRNDRKRGLTRTNHPNKKKYMQMQTKQPLDAGLTDNH